VKISTKQGIIQFVVNGTRPGDFLQAVLRNDLLEAVTRADSDNLRDLRDITKFVYNCAPAKCWRTPEKVNGWIEAGGLKGQGDTKGVTIFMEDVGDWVDEEPE